MLEQEIERGLVVTRVVDGPVNVLGREVFLRDEVPPPDLEPVEPQFGCDLIDHDLDQVCGLGTPGAADRIGRIRVREHPGDLGSDRGDRIATARDDPGGGRDEGVNSRWYAPRSAMTLDLERGNRSVAAAPRSARDRPAPARDWSRRGSRCGTRSISPGWRAAGARGNQRLLPVDVRLAPNPPPTSGTITRSRCSDHPSCLAT